MMKRYGAKIVDGTVTEVLVLADGSDGDDTLMALGLEEQVGVRPGVGWSWDGQVFAAPVPVLTWESVRAQRDRLLAACDWTQIADAPVNAGAWAVYRQALRDIPQDYATPDAVVWPEQP